MNNSGFMGPRDVQIVPERLSPLHGPLSRRGSYRRPVVPENGAVSDVRHVLVLPDRDAAQEASEALGERFGVDEEPRLVRDALAGEDDAEDAQWLVLLRDEQGRLDPAELDEFAGEWEGWREEP